MNDVLGKFENHPSVIKLEKRFWMMKSVLYNLLTQI